MTETSTPTSRPDTAPELSGADLARIVLNQAREVGYLDAVDNPPGAPTHALGTVASARAERGVADSGSAGSTPAHLLARRAPGSSIR